MTGLTKMVRAVFQSAPKLARLLFDHPGCFEIFMTLWFVMVGFFLFCWQMGPNNASGCKSHSLFKPALDFSSRMSIKQSPEYLKLSKIQNIRLLPFSDLLPGSTPWPAGAGHCRTPAPAFPQEPLWLQQRSHCPT